MTRINEQREFLKDFNCRIIDTGKRTQLMRPFEIEDYSDLERNFMETEPLYILEISESGLSSLTRWTRYMNTHFSSDPREFFQRWWAAQETERELREKHPAVSAAYAEYKTLLTLSARNPEKLKPLTQMPD